MKFWKRGEGIIVIRYDKSFDKIAFGLNISMLQFKLNLFIIAFGNKEIFHIYKICNHFCVIFNHAKGHILIVIKMIYAEN